MAIVFFSADISKVSDSVEHPSTMINRRNRLFGVRSVIVGLGMCFMLLSGSAVGQDSNSQQEPDNKDEWARQYLEDDPLAAKEQITLDDLRMAINDPKRRATAISLHFPRVEQATEEEKIAFLLELLRSEHIEVHQQSAQQIERLGALESSVRQLLVEALRSSDQELRKAAVVGLQKIALLDEEVLAEYQRAAEEFAWAMEPEVADASLEWLRSTHGAMSLPLIIRLLHEGELPTRMRAAKALADMALQAREAAILSQAVPSPMRTMQLEAPVQGTPPKSAPPPGSLHSTRTAQDAQPSPVTVYFGTNRQPLERQEREWFQTIRFPILLLIILGLFFFSLARIFAEKRFSISWMVLSLMLLGCFIWAFSALRAELRSVWRIDTHPGFGARRDANDLVHYGTCLVTIPPTHVVGAVEQPLFGPEDEALHVVLQQTVELPKDDFFDQLRFTLQGLPANERDCFVFIHGFNVSFDEAARRTAQIHYDLDFSGMPIFFSWPSRTSLRHYFSDRNEIAYSRFVIKQFLSDLCERLKADRIHVIAHSMGADATCQAIAELGDRGKVFDQVILAAPDIDRDVFSRQLAPRMAKAARRTTMYCSRNDLALMASRTFNDAVRAGDSSRGALVVKDIDTIDASDIDTDLLGHSYYGDCLPILRDVRQILGMDLPPVGRKLIPWPVEDQLIYWTLPGLEIRNSAGSNESLPLP